MALTKTESSPKAFSINETCILSPSTITAIRSEPDVCAAKLRSSPSLSKKYGESADPSRPIVIWSESSSTDISAAALTTTGASFPPMTVTNSSQTALVKSPSDTVTGTTSSPEKFAAGVIV